MYTNFKYAFRHLLKNKLFSLVIIFGLSISAVLVLLLTIFIQTEKNVDQFHSNSNRIFRLTCSGECAFSPPFGQYLADNIEGIESYCRTFMLEATLKSDYNLLKSHSCFYADSNFFSMFSFPLVKGDTRNVLAVRNSVVLSEDFSKRLFPNKDPIGKTIRFNNRLDYVVTGIARDFNETTHFKPADAIFPFIAMADFFGNQQYLSQYDMRYFLPGLYLLAKKDTDLSQKSNEVFTKAKTWYWRFQEKESDQVRFEPLKTVYFQPVQYGFPDGARSGNPNLLILLILIVTGISVIALVNYVNLTVTYSVKRQHERGVKQIIGVPKSYQLGQLLTETTILLLLSLGIAVLILPLILPAFNRLTGYHTSIYNIVASIRLQKVAGWFILFWLISSLLPVLFFSKTTTWPIAKKSNSGVAINRTQSVLVVFQFAIAIVLLVSMITIQRQNHFLRTYNVGFNKEETLFIRLNSEIKNKKLQFKEELKKIAGVKGVSLCNGMPGVGIPSLRFESNNQTQNIDFLNVDEDYFNVMGIGLSTPLTSDPKICLINESAAKALGYKPEDKTIEIEQYGTKIRYEVCEVLPDMNYHSLYDLPHPTLFSKLNTEGWVDYALVRIEPSNIGLVLKQMETTYKMFCSNFPLDFAFLDEQINKAYLRETQTAMIVEWFSVFAILISSLGLFAMTVFSTERRIKEIGIRKVNGATVAEILAMLNKDFIKWIGIAFAIATPVAYFAMEKWLENFAYKTGLTLWVFVLAGLLAVGVAILTVSWQSWTAARRNPIEALKYE